MPDTSEKWPETKPGDSPFGSFEWADLWQQGRMAAMTPGQRAAHDRSIANIAKRCAAQRLARHIKGADKSTAS
jgi:hypothetical protein